MARPARSGSGSRPFRGRTADSVWISACVALSAAVGSLWDETGVASTAVIWSPAVMTSTTPGPRASRGASRSAERVERACGVLKRHGSKVLGQSADVRDYAAISAALAAAFEAFGVIDVLVSGAAGNFPALALGMSANAFKTVVDIDLLGTYNVSKAAFDAWLGGHGGNIVNITAA